MDKVQFGATGRVVTPMGLGLAALGRPGYINLGHEGDLAQGRTVAAMEVHAHRVLDAAWAAGIRYFDAARSYGRAEAFLASWLASRNIDPAEVTVASKWGYTYTAGWQVTADVHEVKEHSLPVFTRQIAETKALLGRYLNVYQVHSATLASGVLTNEPVLAALAALRDEGTLIGLSLSGVAQADTLEKAVSIEVGGVPLFSVVQVTWNVLEPSAGGALERASARGMAVVVKEAVANGRLTSRNHSAAFASKRAILERIAAQYETTIDAVALAAVLAQPWASVVLSGAAAVAHIAPNVQATTLRLDEAVLDELYALAVPAETYWQERSALTWN